MDRIWTTKTAMPGGQDGLAAVAVNGKLYAIGRSFVAEYDPVGNTWTLKASMPTGRTYLAAAAVNGKIYVIGGYTGTGVLNTVEEY